MMDRLEKWTAKLESGEISDRELDELEALLADDYESRERFLDHSQIAGLLYSAGKGKDGSSNEKVIPIDKLETKPQTGVNNGNARWRSFAVASLLLLSIGGVWLFIPSDDDSSLEISATKTATTPVSADEHYQRSIQKTPGGASLAHPETATVGAEAAHSKEITFNRDIRPILSDKCVFCHGPDAADRKADLRFDTEEGAMAAIVRGDPDASELITRIFHEDADERMPPSNSSRSLSPKERDTLKRWIAEGATWQKHWAFEAPRKPEGEGIDFFIEKKLKEKNFQMSPEANKETLIRRASLDLTGIPPAVEEVDAFLEDASPEAYENLLDRLLASPRYAERMTWQWLEAARYADTDGYQNDGPRDMWRWRDWVLEAYGANLPFDQFTIEQLAGDLLSNPTLDQKIATGFNRNHRYNSESGLVLEEFLLENAVDRIDTTSTVWMGLTVGCARCHDHKYDPISQKDYYQLISFFDSVPESGRAIKVGNSEPWIKAPTADQQKKLYELDAKIADAKAAFAKYEPAIEKQVASQDKSSSDTVKPIVSQGLDHHFAANEPIVADGSGPLEVSKEKIPGLSSHTRFSISFRMTPAQVDQGAVLSNETKDTGRKGIFVEFREGHLRFVIVSRWIAGVGMLETLGKFSGGKKVHITLTNDGTQRARGMRIYVDGEPVKTRVIHNTNSNKNEAGGPMLVGGSKHLPAWKGELEDLRFYGTRTLQPSEAKLIARGTDPIRSILEHGNPGKEIQSAWKKIEQLKLERQQFHDSIQTTMVMVDSPKAEPTRLRVRGEYHNKGEAVEPRVPEIFPPLPEGQPDNRLGFAKWLVSGQHPLTARVAVNRYWQMLFGRGLVKTAEDFGTQGSPPTHPEVLDWLAVEFVENNWDVRHILKTIMMSRTYRQSSNITSDLRERDPTNVWLARAPRMKLSGNVLRDQALFSSGLLVEKTGGVSVKPYQPANMWKEASNYTYQADKGENLYRRSLYTYWKRTLAPPSMAVLDTADREWCSVKPKSTNTPLQALTLLNETAFFESARKLGEKILLDGGSSVSERIDFAFQKVLARKASDREREILASGWANYLAECEKNPEAIREIQKVGESLTSEGIDAVELGAATALANVIYNLEEASVRE